MTYDPLTGCLTPGCDITSTNVENTPYQAEFYTTNKPVTV